MRALMSSPFSLFFFTFSLSRDCQLTLWELAGDSCRGRLLGRVASILGRRLSTPLPAPALTPLQPALSPAARVILVRHQSLIRVLPWPQLSSHPPPFSALFSPSLHFSCGIFSPPKSKEFLCIVSHEMSLSQTKEARSCLRTLPLLFPLAGTPFPQIPILFYLSQGMWSFLFEKCIFIMCIRALNLKKNRRMYMCNWILLFAFSHLFKSLYSLRLSLTILFFSLIS